MAFIKWDRKFGTNYSEIIQILWFLRRFITHIWSATYPGVKLTLFTLRCVYPSWQDKYWAAGRISHHLSLWETDQLTLGRGQHPHCPLDNLQHVWSLAQVLWPSGHSGFGSGSPIAIANTFFTITTVGSRRLLGLHFPWAVSHVYPFGQQCRWSLQHTAYR